MKRRDQIPSVNNGSCVGRKCSEKKVKIYDNIIIIDRIEKLNNLK